MLQLPLIIPDFTMIGFTIINWFNVCYTLRQEITEPKDTHKRSNRLNSKTRRQQDGDRREEPWERERAIAIGQAGCLLCNWGGEEDGLINWGWSNLPGN